MRVLRCALVLLLLSGVGACADRPRDRGGVPVRVRCAGGVADSADAVALALDTLARLDRYRSAVVRFARDSAGYRLVTVPAPEPTMIVFDGMAIVHVSRECRVTRVVQTDSA